MELILIALVIIVIIVVVTKNRHARQFAQQSQSTYHYSRKDTIMTQAEIAFFNRLQTVAGDRYHIFPQIHLTALAKNETRGKYYKLSYQRINRRSVDYVLCDKITFKPSYAVELDDTTHDKPKRQARDTIVEAILNEINLPLVRFRNTTSLTDDDIARTFYEAHEHNNGAKSYGSRSV